MKKTWNTLYKVLAVALLAYAIIYGLTASIPKIALMEQSSRILFFHVPMWFTVIVLMTISVVQSIRFLRMIDPDYQAASNPLLADAKAHEAARIGLLFSALGLITGSIWGRVTWKAHMEESLALYWTNDPILVCALISALIYMAYFLLRASFGEPEQRAKVAAVYNIFAFATLIPLYFIIPRILPGLHPTADGSDAGGGSFVLTSSKAIDNSYRMILYPGALGFIFMGLWIYELRYRLQHLRIKWENIQAEEEYLANQNPI